VSCEIGINGQRTNERPEKCLRRLLLAVEAQKYRIQQLIGLRKLDYPPAKNIDINRTEKVCILWRWTALRYNYYLSLKLYS